MTDVIKEREDGTHLYIRALFRSKRDLFRSKRDLLLERMTHTVATYSTKAMYKQKRPIEKQKRPTTKEDDTHRSHLQHQGHVEATETYLAAKETYY